MKYEKGSFIIVPNKSTLEGIDPYAQLIFFWLCEFADEDGTCYPSRTTLANRANVSLSTVDRALTKLEELGLVTIQQRYYEAAPTTNHYQLMIVEGGSVLGTIGGVPQTRGVASHRRTELNPVLTQETSEPKVRVSLKDEEKLKPQRNAKYPHSKEVFALFPKVDRSWFLDKTQLRHAEQLYSRGLDNVKAALKFYSKIKDDEFAPKIRTPYELNTKWLQLVEYR